MLIAEDNKVNQQVARLIVQHDRHRVDDVDNGVQALEAVNASRYDVVLMDLQMPELDGIGAAQQIRGLTSPARDVPIIALTSHAMAGTREEVLAAGMDDYISKPFDTAVLLAKIEHLAAFNAASSVAATRAARSDGDGRGPKPANTSKAGERVETRFDRRKLDQLYAVTQPATFRPLLVNLIDSMEIRLDAIATLIGDGDFADAGREAHDLVAIAGNLGGMRLSALARQMQLAGAGGNAEQCGAAAASLQKEADSLLPLIRDYQAAMAA